MAREKRVCKVEITSTSDVTAVYIDKGRFVKPKGKEIMTHGVNHSMRVRIADRSVTINRITGHSNMSEVTVYVAIKGEFLVGHIDKGDPGFTIVKTRYEQVKNDISGAGGMNRMNFKLALTAGAQEIQFSAHDQDEQEDGEAYSDDDCE